jgi:hypothetical protein
MSFRKRHFGFLRRLALGLAIAAVVAPTALATYQAGEGVRSAPNAQELQARALRSEALEHLYNLRQPGGVTGLQGGGVIGLRSGGQIPYGLLPNGMTIEQLRSNDEGATRSAPQVGGKAPLPRPTGRGSLETVLASGQRHNDSGVDLGDSAAGFGVAAGLGLLAAGAMIARNRRKLATGF